MFKTKSHNLDLYNTLLKLSRNLFFYNNINLKDTFETRVYLMFMHFSTILIIYKIKKVNFPQNSYDSLFDSIENNLRELGLGDVAVNKKMKILNKIFYDILLKISKSKSAFELNPELVLKYFADLDNSKTEKYLFFERYFINFYNFCFELHPETMIKDALNFKV
jgi:cytochrome b pre-mRNA-processing protein 3